MHDTSTYAVDVKPGKVTDIVLKNGDGDDDNYFGILLNEEYSSSAEALALISYTYTTQFASGAGAPGSEINPAFDFTAYASTSINQYDGDVAMAQNDPNNLWRGLKDFINDPNDWFDFTGFYGKERVKFPDGFLSANTDPIQLVGQSTTEYGALTNGCQKFDFKKGDQSLSLILGSQQVLTGKDGNLTTDECPDAWFVQDVFDGDATPFDSTGSITFYDRLFDSSVEASGTRFVQITEQADY